MTSYAPVGYTYEAAVHCPECTVERFAHVVGEWIDREGNPVGAICPWDEMLDLEHCDDCRDCIGHDASEHAYGVGIDRDAAE